MQIDKLIPFLHTIERLKCILRHSWTSSGRQESVAEHSWRLALMACLISDEFPDADMDRVIRMCLIHDFGEAVTGDIPAFHKTDAHEAAEDDAIRSLLSLLPEDARAELSQLFEEMSALETQEAKIFKALDKMEAVLSHNEAALSTWIPLEHELNLVYGDECVAFSQYMTDLRRALREESEQKMKNE